MSELYIPKWIRFSNWVGSSETDPPKRRYHGFGSLKAPYVDSSAHYVEGEKCVTMKGRFTAAELREVADMVEWVGTP